jgi:peroxiredoxin
MKLNQLAAPVALAVAAALVVALGMRVRALNRENDALFLRATRPYAGMYVPAFTTRSLDGGAVTVASPARRQVLFVFTTTCPFCRTSIPAWTRIGRAAEAAYGRGGAVGLSLDGVDSTLAYVRAHGLAYPVARFPDARTRSLYRSRTVPVTLVVDSTGRVVFSRIGEVREGMESDSVLAAAGLRPPPASARRTVPAAEALAARTRP